MEGLNLLVSAYACNPLATEESYPGEAILGWNLVKQLSRFFNVSVITRTYNREGILESVKKEELEGVRFYYLALPRFLSFIRQNFLGFSLYYLLWQIKAYFLAKKISARSKFDVFHHITFNNDWMPSFIGAYLPFPFIWGPMGGGQKIPASFKKTIHWKNRINQELRVAGQWFWRHTVFRHKCVKRALAILVCNKDTEEKIKISPEKIYPFPVNGISLDELNSRRDSLDHIDHVYRIIYAGRLDAIKGLNLGIKAFSLLAKHIPDSRFEIIGVGPEKVRLEKLIREFGLEGKVRLTSWMERADLLTRMSESDVVLFPSFRDGGGQVVIEAMAQGKPVIGMNIGGPGFHIQKEWGFKIEPKDPEYAIQEMAKALERLYLDKSLRLKMGEAGYRRARDYYLWERLGDRLQHIYQEVLPKELSTKETAHTA